jgi:hypothetical protein
MEPKIVLPGTKRGSSKGYPMRTAEDPFLVLHSTFFSESVHVSLTWTNLDGGCTGIKSHPVKLSRVQVSSLIRLMFHSLKPTNGALHYHHFIYMADRNLDTRQALLINDHQLQFPLSFLTLCNLVMYSRFKKASIKFVISKKWKMNQTLLKCPLIIIQIIIHISFCCRIIFLLLRTGSN